jgi:hypothetical protein
MFVFVFPVNSDCEQSSPTTGRNQVLLLISFQEPAETVGHVD